MHHFKVLGYDDAAMYFNGTLATDVNGEIYHVSTTPDGNRAKYGIQSIAGGERKLLSAKDFFDTYVVSKFPLGWFTMNYDGKLHAVHLMGAPSRRARKGYTSADIRSHIPYCEGLTQAYNKLRHHAVHAVEYGTENKISDTIRNKLEDLSQKIEELDECDVIRNVEQSLANPKYYTVDDALQMLQQKNNCSGVALSAHFAVSLSKHFAPPTLALYYHTKVIGYYDKQLYAFKPFKHLVPELNREVEQDVSIATGH